LMAAWQMLPTCSAGSGMQHNRTPACNTPPAGMGWPCGL
jgi:hypothetical protein